MVAICPYEQQQCSVPSSAVLVSVLCCYNLCQPHQHGFGCQHMIYQHQLAHPSCMHTIPLFQGLLPFEGHDLATGETSTKGLDSLAASAAEYVKAGARFAKWRAALRIHQARGFPSERAVELNAEQLADYAVVCQAAGLVPIVEPEVLIDGPHSMQVSV